MQLKLECSCGANAYWNGDNTHQDLQFAKQIWKDFSEHHRGHGGMKAHQDTVTLGKFKDDENEFIQERDFNMDERGFKG